MQKFKKLPNDNLKDLPINERINMFKKMAREFGKIITHKEAKYFYKQSLKGDKYQNNKYIVDVYRGKDADDMVLADEMKGKCTYLSIKRIDKGICNDWRDFQQIKNELVGEDIEALQIYPAESDLWTLQTSIGCFVFLKV